MLYDVGIGYGDGIAHARAVILGVLRDEPGVSPDPAADVIVTALAESTVTLRARWWSDARMSDVLLAMATVAASARDGPPEFSLDPVIRAPAWERFLRPLRQ